MKFKIKLLFKTNSKQLSLPFSIKQNVCILTNYVSWASKSTNITVIKLIPLIINKIFAICSVMAS